MGESEVTTPFPVPEPNVVDEGCPCDRCLFPVAFLLFLAAAGEPEVALLTAVNDCLCSNPVLGCGVGDAW